MRYNPFKFLRLYRHSFLERILDTIIFLSGYSKINEQILSEDHDYCDDDSDDDEIESTFIIRSHLGLFDWILIAPIFIFRIAEVHDFFSILLFIPAFILRLATFVASFWITISLSPIILIVHLLLRSRVRKVEEGISNLGNDKVILISDFKSEFCEPLIKERECFIVPVYTDNGKSYKSGIVFNDSSKMLIAIYAPKITGRSIHIVEPTEKNHPIFELMMDSGYFIVHNRDRIDAYFAYRFSTFGRQAPSTPISLSPHITSVTKTTEQEGSDLKEVDLLDRNPSFTDIH
jgi:hypothetical protein